MVKFVFSKNMSDNYEEQIREDKLKIQRGVKKLLKVPKVLLRVLT